MWVKENGAADKDGISVPFDAGMTLINAGSHERMDSFGERGPDLPAAQSPAPGVEANEDIVAGENKIDEFRARGFDAEGRSMREREATDRDAARKEADAKNAADSEAAKRAAADQAAAAAAAKKAAAAQ